MLWFSDPLARVMSYVLNEIAVVTPEAKVTPATTPASVDPVRLRLRPRVLVRIKFGYENTLDPSKGILTTDAPSCEC